MAEGISRRRLLKASLATAATAAATTAAGTSTTAAQATELDLRTFPSPELQPYVDELPVPQTIRGDHRLAMAASTHRFHRDLAPAPTWSYGGAEYLGPTIEAHANQRLELTFDNKLGKHLFAADVDPTLDGASEESRTRPHTSVHLHGAVTPPEMDGHPMDVFLPGEHRSYRHENRQPAAGLWYHDHGMGLTRLNVHAGLAGMYLLRDDGDTGDRANAWHLPSGEFELPLILADRRFHPDGSLNYRTLTLVPQGHWDGGQIGDRLTVNGKVSPYLEVARGQYRFRVLNASNFRAYHLFFRDRRPFHVIGNDAGLLDGPVVTTEIRLTPGERADLVVDFSDLERGEHVDLVNDQQEAALIALVTGAQPLPDVVRFTSTGAKGHQQALPTRLRVMKKPQAPDRRRVVTLTQDLKLTRWPPVGMSLNNLCFEDDPIAMPRQGTTELWEVVNLTIEDHPVHLHLVNLHLVNRQMFDPLAYSLANPRPPLHTEWAPPEEEFLLGAPQPPAPWEAGPKDTVNCPQNTVTRFLVHFPTADELGFDPDATFTPARHAMTGHDMGRHDMDLQGYVWHCHILDHEDDCMMARYRLVQ